jgi:hypothetical protein
VSARAKAAELRTEVADVRDLIAAMRAARRPTG